MKSLALNGPPYVSPVEPFRHRLSFLFSSYPSPLPLTPSHQRIVQHHQKLHCRRCTGQRVACQLLHMFRVRVPCSLCGPTDNALDSSPVAVILFRQWLIHFLLYSLKPVLLLIDPGQRIPQNAMSSHITGDSQRVQDVSHPECKVCRFGRSHFLHILPRPL